MYQHTNQSLVESFAHPEQRQRIYAHTHAHLHVLSPCNSTNLPLVTLEATLDLAAKRQKHSTQRHFAETLPSTESMHCVAHRWLVPEEVALEKLVYPSHQQQDFRQNVIAQEAIGFVEDPLQQRQDVIEDEVDKSKEQRQRI
jgi:hypothetical protein